MIPALDDPELQRDVANIQEKREVLQQIIDIAKAIENMQDSLDSVLVLGVPSKDMPDCAMEMYGTVSEALKSLPVNKLKEYQENLERLVKSKLDTILKYAGADFESDDSIESLTLSSDDEAQSPLELLEDFKRTAQTTVSLRVLLRKRGVATPGAKLPVPKDVIAGQLEHLKVQEQQQRTKIKGKIEEMQEDVQKMIDNPSYPQGMKDMLEGVQANLSNDIERLAAGAPLGNLSFVVDAEEIVAAGVEDEVEEIEITDVAPDDGNVGLADAASRWLNSPWDVSWDDVKHGGR